MLEACGWAAGAGLAAERSEGGRKSGWNVGARSQVLSTKARAPRLGPGSRARPQTSCEWAGRLPGWAGKGHGEQLSRGYGGSQTAEDPICAEGQVPWLDCSLSEMPLLEAASLGGSLSPSH